MSTYSSNLKIELIGTGEQTGTWGTTTNSNFSNVFEQSIVGRVAVNFATDANKTLSTSDSVASQDFRNVYLNLTSSGSLTVTRDLIVPTINKNYVIQNNTTGGQSIRVITAAGTGITVPNGTTCAVYVDGTNVIQASDYAPTFTVGSLNVTTLDLTNLEVTNIKAKDGTASASIADSTGIFTHSTATVFTAGTVSAPAITTTGDTNTGIFFPAADTIAFTEGGVESMRITSAGNVGINTTDPDYGSYGATERILGITGVATNRGRLSLQNTSTGTTGVSGTIAFFNSSTLLASLDIIADGATNSGRYVFNTNNAGSFGERMRITSVGNVGIGGIPLSDSRFLISNGGAVGMEFSPNLAIVNENRLLSYNRGTSAYAPMNYDASTHQFLTGGSERMRIDSSGNVGIGTSSPTTYSAKLAVVGSGTVTSAVIGTSAGLYSTAQSAGGSFTQYYKDFTPTYVAGVGCYNPSAGSAVSAIWFGDYQNSTGSWTERMRLDSSGNLGLGVAPSAWGSNYKALQMPGGSAIVGRTDANVSYFGNNVYFGTFNSERYIASDVATMYIQSSGTHRWYNAASGTAGNVITFTNTMTLDASGNLGVGVTGPGVKLDVAGAIRSIVSGGTPIVYLSNGTTQHSIQNTSGAFTFFVDGTERMRLDSAGNALFTNAVRATVNTNNTLTFNMNNASNFKSTLSAGGALTFTNITSGQTGNIILVNGSNYAITAAATTKVSATCLATISATGTYWLSYYSDGTNVYVANTGALA